MFNLFHSKERLPLSNQFSLEEQKEIFYDDLLDKEDFKYIWNDSGYAEEQSENPFCEAILQIPIRFGITEILPDIPPTFDDIMQDFDKNGKTVTDTDINGLTHEIQAFALTFIENGKGCKIENVPRKYSKEKKSNAKDKKDFKMKNDNSENCRFCLNNGSSIYMCHTLRDSQNRVSCPILRKYVCPICGATGDDAHTVRYCSKKPVYAMKGNKVVRCAKNIRV